MKVLFTGPTLYGLDWRDNCRKDGTLTVRGPAAQGDIFKAVREGANVIGLVDGRYEDVAAPWHKEILHALSLGVQVLGGGSLGALRAAECAAFGMIGVGAIFERYMSGQYVDDADVAQLHGPEELAFVPITEPMVNIEATLGRIGLIGALASEQIMEIRQIARGLFFKELTISALVQKLPYSPKDVELVENMMRRHRVDQKRLDALELLDVMKGLPDARSATDRDWILAQPHQWRRFVAGEGNRK